MEHASTTFSRFHVSGYGSSKIGKNLEEKTVSTQSLNIPRIVARFIVPPRLTVIAPILFRFFGANFATMKHAV
jgi:hypothetical protein